MVPVDFNSGQIKLPSDYYFGITAASADTPDTFEVYKFVTTTSSSVAREEPRRNQPPPPGQQDQQYQQPPAYQQAQQPADTQASQYASQSAQFEDLHNRLQTMAHAIENIQQAVSKLTGDSEGRHREISRNVMSADQLNAMDTRIQGIEKTVRDYQKEFSSLQAIFKDSHGNLMQSLPAHVTDSESFQIPENVFSFGNPLLIQTSSHTHQVSAHRPFPLHDHSIPSAASRLVRNIQAKASARTEEVPVDFYV